MRVSPIDLGIILGYNAAIVVFGCYFAWRTRDPERFMAAGRSLPGWTVGLSIFGSFVSSISFLALPGKAFAEDWNYFVFSLSLLLAAPVAAAVFVPFYRRSGHVSAYHHLEERFGRWARTYAAVCYLLIQLTRTGMVTYLLALVLAGLFDAAVANVILVLGLLMTIYPLVGGTEAVIWTGAVQSCMLGIGALVCAVSLPLGMPEGPSQIFRIAQAHGKFSLGSFNSSLLGPGIMVVLLYGLAENLRNFGITQTYVQSYITARSDRAAKASVWIAAMLYIPVSALFFFIGTALFAYFSVHVDRLPAEVAASPDKVLPHYIMACLPAGLMGLVVAAVCAAATDSNFNSVATLFLCDVYKAYFRPGASDHESLWVLRLSTLGAGLVSTCIALGMIGRRSALDAWWALAGILSGGMLGLFLLGLMSTRPRGSVAAVALGLGTAVILWMTISLESFMKLFPGFAWPAALARFRSPFDPLAIPVLGTVTVVLAGLLLSRLVSRTDRSPGAARRQERADAC